MQKKITTIIIVISSLINILAATFIFLDIQVMEAPDTTIRMEIFEINSKEAIIQTTLNIKNPNSFDIIVRDLEIFVTNPQGKHISSLKIDGKNIQPNENITIVEYSTVDYNGSGPDKLIAKVSSVVGMKVGFIEKTIPLSIKMISDVEDVINNIITPTMTIQTSISNITQKRSNINLEIDVNNPNTFDIKIEEIFVDLKNEKGEKVGNLTIPSLKLKSNKSNKVFGKCYILLESLNSKNITITIETNVGATLAGYEKKLPLKVTSIINIPNLNELLKTDFPTQAVLRSDYRRTLFGLASAITLESHNPSDIEYYAKDITIEIFRIDKNTRRKVSEGVIESGVLKPKNITILKGEVRIPYRKIFIPPLGGRILPDWLEVRISANITISGLDSYFWVAMVAYQDLHFVRRDKVYKDPINVEWE